MSNLEEFETALQNIIDEADLILNCSAILSGVQAKKPSSHYEVAIDALNSRLEELRAEVPRYGLALKLAGQLTTYNLAVKKLKI